MSNRMDQMLSFLKGNISRLGSLCGFIFSSEKQQTENDDNIPLMISWQIVVNP